jgi:acyl-coenzyme A thioesterase PaaI-like protein
MQQPIVNRDLLPGNTCFGCGFDNPHGLHIALHADPDRPDGLVGTFDPPAHGVGFPGLVHGGAVYTALDCAAAWTPTALRPAIGAIWILRSAEVKYLKAAFLGRPLAIRTAIVEEGGPWEAMKVRAEARDAEGDVVVEGVFKVIPLPPDRFLRVAGIERFPPGWEAFFASRR